jgi:P4 family phage/plasmid primase-like protien
MTAPKLDPTRFRSLADQGLSVIPIRHPDRDDAPEGKRGKTPAVTWKQYQKAAAPAALVDRWEREGFNVGLVTGRVSGLVVLDLDREDLVAELDGRGLELPETAIVRTGRGWHFYFRHPGGRIGNAAGLAGIPGLDLRGDGGYVVAPGSIHESGRVYSWERGLEALQDPPSWLLELIRKPKERPKPAPATGGNGKRPAAAGEDRYARAALQGEIGRVANAAKGTRNNTLNRAAFALGQLVEAGRLDQAEAERELTAAAEACGLIGDDGAESVRKTIASGLGDGKAHPRAPEAPPARGAGGNAKRPGLRVVSGKTGGMAEAMDAAAAELTAHAWSDQEEAGGSWGESTLNDTANARRLVRFYGERLRYCHPWSRWLVWDGRRWRSDDTAQVERWAKDTVRRIYFEAGSARNQEQQERLAKHAVKSGSAKALREMIALSRSETGIPVLPDELDRNPWLLTVGNGTVELRTGELRPHAPGDLITKGIETPYDPEARCPRWERFLQEIMPDAETVDFLQRAVGYSLTADTREQCFFILYGSGANGKSTFVETLLALLQEYALRTPTETFLAKKGDTIPNDVARLKGARFVSASEVEEGRRLSESVVKQLTGTDTMSARFMRGEWFDFRPCCKLWLSTNHRPTIRGTDEAIWRRIRLIPFEQTFPPERRDPDLLAKLAGELPGILAWAIRGALLWAEKGLEAPGKVRNATGQYREEMDTLLDFLQDETEEAPEAFTPSKDLYERYLTWAQRSGEKRPMSKRAFGLRLGERGFSPHRTEEARGWKGLYLRPGSWLTQR